MVDRVLVYRMCYSNIDKSCMELIPALSVGCCDSQVGWGARVKFLGPVGSAQPRCTLEAPALLSELPCLRALVTPVRENEVS